MQEKGKIHGIRTVMEAILMGKNFEKVFLQHGIRGNLFTELIELLKTREIHFTYTPLQKLNRLTKNNHQGVVAFISPIPFIELEDLVEKTLEVETTPLFLLLDGVTDVRNFGAILRTAECTGVNGVIVAKNSSAPVNADTIKTSSGAAFKIPICRVDHLKDAIFYLKASGIKTVAATEKADHDIYGHDLTQPTALIMGSEGSGINPKILKEVDSKAKLPMLGTIGSLNVSVACGAMLYEIVRQRTS